MAKPRKKPTAQPATAEPPPMPLIGDKVTMPRSKSVLEINHVSRDGNEVDLLLPGTTLQWFRVRTDTLTFVNNWGSGPSMGISFHVPRRDPITSSLFHCRNH